MIRVRMVRAAIGVPGDAVRMPSEYNLAEAGQERAVRLNTESGHSSGAEANCVGWCGSGEMLQFKT